jgi:hypothetical protein
MMAVALVVSLRFAFLEAHPSHLRSPEYSLKVHLEGFRQGNHTQNHSPRIPPQDPSEPYPIVVLPYNGSVDPFYNIPSDGTNLWDDDPKLPAWMKAYFNWHKHRRTVMDPNQWADERWMIMQCLASHDARRCGGTADRLVSLQTGKVKSGAENSGLIVCKCRSPSPRY